MIRGDVLRKVAVLVLVLGILFYRGGVVFGQNSAVFRVVSIVPPPAQGGKKIIFVVRITNTGTESWVSGEYSLFVKIYDENKNYLTETDKIRQFKDIDPGEVLTANVDFDIPVEYSGTYHYLVGIEFEKETLLSHYFILKILPFVAVPEVKRWTGSVQVGYQDDQVVEATTTVNLRLVNLPGHGNYLKFSTSGQDTATTEPKLSNFLVSYHSKKLGVSAGDFISALSPLTLSRSRGVKVENKSGRVSLVGLVGSSEKTFEGDLYGLRGSTTLTDKLELAANYIKGNKGQNSVASLQGELTISPEITLSGEYGWSSFEGQETEQERKRGNAFRLSTSVCYEELTLDASYKKVPRDFSFVGNPSTGSDYEQYDLSLNLHTDYINGTVYYNKYHSGLSQNSDRLITTSAGADLTASFPKLPLLLLSYSLDKTYNSKSGNLLINDAVGNLTMGFSYLVGKTKVSANYLKFSYADTAEPAADETIVSTNYGLSVPWGKRTTLSANYVISSTEDSTNTTHSRSISLGARYRLTLGKLLLLPQYKVSLVGSGQRSKTTTSLGISYSFTRKSALRLNYILTNYGELVNPGRAIFGKFSIDLGYQYSLAKNHRLELNYHLDDQRNFTAVESSPTTRDSGLRLIYKYHF